MENRELIIKQYVEGYNHFDVDQMVAHFAEHLIFENIQNGTTTLRLEGLAAFKSQAEAAKSYFSVRRQTITAFTHTDNQTEVALAYYAVLAMDFPNGLQKGQEIHLTGKSVFEFAGHQVVKLTDIS